ncbi:hypothetical protein DXG01_016270 [Tephrocybe rancida]|nr:hypothetical protein DXG01_016270 [Tephrocybe rancida]
MAIDLDKINERASARRPSELAKSSASKVKLDDGDLSNRVPIKRLPSEILAKIFLSTPPDYVYDRWATFPAHKAVLPRISFHQGSSADPMTLAQVCHQWRDVALSTPLLWSSINILCSDKRQQVPLLEAWLERSSDCPLSIRFVESVAGSAAHDEKFDFPQSPFTADIMSLLVAQAHRWKEIDFSFSRQISPVLSNIALTSFPILETASIVSRQATDHTFGGVAPLKKVWQAIHSSPSFCSGRWEMEYLEENLKDIPWGQLTAIDVTMPLDSLFRILPLCPNLVELRYTDPLYAYNPTTLSSDSRPLCEDKPEEEIVMPKLRRLSLRMDQPPHTILDRLTLPKLSSYNIQLYTDNVERPHGTSLLDLLDRSQCRLEHFRYDDPEDDAEAAVVTILSSPHFSSLMELDLKPRTTDLLIDLLHRTKSQNILPRLERLFLGPCSTRSGALSGMVLSRQSVTDEFASLGFVEVGRWDRHPQDLECLQILSGEGVLMVI